MSNTDVEFLEVFERNVLLDWFSLVGSGFVSLLSLFQLTQLSLDSLILNLLEEQLRLCQLLTSWEKVGRTKFTPVILRHVYHLTKFLTAEWQEWFEGNTEVGNELKRDIENGLYTLRVGLPKLPRLCLCYIFVTDAGEVHSLFLCLTELKDIEISLYLCLNILELLDSLAVNLFQFTTSRNHTIPILLGQLQCTINEVTIYSNEFRVVTLLEVFPSEVVIFGFWCVSSQYIA